MENINFDPVLFSEGKRMYARNQRNQLLEKQTNIY